MDDRIPAVTARHLLTGGHLRRRVSEFLGSAASAPLIERCPDWMAADSELSRELLVPQNAELRRTDARQLRAPQSRVASVIVARKLASSSPHMRIGYGLAAVLARIVVVLPHPCLMPAVRAGYFNVRH